MSSLDYEIPWGLFDGACEGHPLVFGVGVIFHLRKNHYIHICYVLGSSTNNRVEFISLWTLLEATIKKDVKKMQVLGDSKLVIEWAKQKIKVQDIRLESLLKDIKFPFRSFEWISFSHILQEVNEKENSLSKEALLLPVGAFGYYEFMDGEDIEAMEFRLWATGPD